jgi:hypothetical protein
VRSVSIGRFKSLAIIPQINPSDINLPPIRIDPFSAQGKQNS